MIEIEDYKQNIKIKKEGMNKYCQEGLQERHLFLKECSEEIWVRKCMKGMAFIVIG